jgi:hypothetical protein
MKIVRTGLMPDRKLAAINLFGIVFAPKSGVLLQKTINHEAIHLAQMKEMLFIFFYLWYAMEWLVRLFGKGNAYRNIAFEKEAYAHEQDKHYLKRRRPYAWLKWL